jgi:CTP-dependent riboflavin kinase
LIVSLLTDLAATIDRFETRTIQQKIVFTMWVIEVAERRSSVSKKRIRNNLLDLNVSWTDRSGGTTHFNALEQKELVDREKRSSGSYWSVTEKGKKPLEKNYGAKLRAMMAHAAEASPADELGLVAVHQVKRFSW